MMVDDGGWWYVVDDADDADDADADDADDADDAVDNADDAADADADARMEGDDGRRLNGLCSFDSPRARPRLVSASQQSACRRFG